MNPWSPRIQELPERTVAVVGAGSAGCCAAIQAARVLGPGRVVLIERYGYLGGASTGVLDTFYGFFSPGDDPRRVVGGLPAEVVDRLDDKGVVMLRPNTYGAGTGVTYGPEHLKRVWDELCAEAGMVVLHHALLVDAGPREAVFATKSGFLRQRAPFWIDASGDADLCHLSGVPYEKAGDLDPAQSLTTTFKMAGVDTERYRREGGNRMLNERMATASELPRKKGSVHDMVIDGCIATVAVKVADVDATDVVALSAAEAEGRRQAFVYEQFLRAEVPGYERARIIGLSVGIGVRETRRVYGEYRLTRDDCLSSARFDDRIGLCAAPMEDHRPGPTGGDETAWAYMPDNLAYDIPYATLVPKGRQDLWVAGRCFSATHDAHASCRSMAQTMLMGQAAGLAAGLTASEGFTIESLQVALRHTGAILEDPPRADTRVWRSR